MTASRDSLPVITRSDSDIVLISEWTVDTPERQQATAETAINAWEHDWPEGLLSHNCFVGIEDTTVLHYSQWTSEEAADDGMHELDAVVDSERHAITPYRLYRSFVPEGSRPRGCIVVISFETDGPEWQHKLVDWLVDRLPDNPPPPGNIANHFHLSTDGTRVFNYTEWTSEEAHRDTVETNLQEDDEIPQMLAAMNGVRGLGYKRFTRYRSLAKS